MINYILDYHEKIKTGEEIACKWIKLIFGYLAKGLQEKWFYYDQKKADKAIKFIENFCHHCEGRNDLIVLEFWQKAVTAAIFGIVDVMGLRIFREVVIVIGRKNGKSLWVSAIANYCLLMDGEYGAKIYCVAPKLDQADIVYGAIWQMIESEDEMKNLVKKRKADYYVKLTNSSVKKIAFNSKKSDGFNPHLTICDEIASWPGDTGLKQYEVMKSAMGARSQPLIISISTSGYINDGIYDELIKRATRFLFGYSKEKRLLPFLFMIDDLKKWDDMKELKKANPNLGVSVSEEYLAEEIAIAKGSLSKKAEFITKYCNIKQNSSQAWLPSISITDCFGTEIDINELRNSYAVGGLDLSRTTDLTAAVVVIEKKELLYVLAKFFLPAEKIEEATARDGLPYGLYIQKGFLQVSGENFVNYHDCFNWYRELVEKYKIYPLKTGYDRYSSTYLVNEMKDYGFHMDDVYQGYNLTPVINETEGLIKDKKIYCGENDLLKIHLLNAAMKNDIETERKKLVKIAATDHVDGCAALLDAMTVRQKHWPEIGRQLKNER